MLSLPRPESWWNRSWWRGYESFECEVLRLLMEFSTAVIAVRASAVCKQSANTGSSRSTVADTDAGAIRHRRRVARAAAAGRAATRVAAAFAACDSVSCATTWLTSPAAKAEWRIQDRNAIAGSSLFRPLHRQPPLPPGTPSRTARAAREPPCPVTPAHRPDARTWRS